MLTAFVYNVFDIHDTKPFPIDPESLLLLCSPLLMLAFTVLLRVPLTAVLVFLLSPRLLPCGCETMAEVVRREPLNSGFGTTSLRI